ncbi:metal-dependent hydrolase [Halomarina litorea]|uniref:metal-dependent hydrolase n=1 Tax=Halomarina litorea TaxID=2961595 RepID=UPI0020C1BBB3|nr:metal-dependent hydrolase [Halomarina sp. BCD28]
MPDLLSHALIAYSLCTLLALRYDWLAPRYVTVGMAGAFVPDLAKADLLVEGATVGSALGVPFDWFGLHTLGGAAVAVLVGVVLVASEERARVGSLLSLGAASHLVADAFLAKAASVSYPVFWPITQYHPPTPGLYLSTDYWPAVATGVVALCVWALVRRPGGLPDRGRLH